jgi:hypothetical protein
MGKIQCLCALCALQIKTADFFLMSLMLELGDNDNFLCDDVHAAEPLR